MFKRQDLDLLTTNKQSFWYYSLIKTRLDFYLNNHHNEKYFTVREWEWVAP